MKKLMTYIKPAVWALVLLSSLPLSAQQYGALKYTLQKRPQSEKFDSSKWSDHLFVSGGLGGHTLLTSAGDGLGLSAHAFVGTWLTPLHGLRLGGQGMFLPNTLYEGYQVRTMGGTFDYLLDISSLTYNYNFQRRFKLLGVLGADAGYSRVKGDEGMYWGGHIGLQAALKVSNGVDLFIEPRMSWTNKELVQNGNWRGYNMLGSVLAGVTYNMVPDKDRQSTTPFKSESFTDHLFLSYFGGINIQKYGRLEHALEQSAFQLGLGVGKWFTPSSAVRLSALAGYGQSPVRSREGHFKTLQFRGDYILSLDQAFAGYRDDRIFTLNAIAGFNMAMTRQGHQAMRYAPGVGVGLQSNFRLASDLALFIEPRMNVFSDHYAGGLSYLNKDVVLELNAGLIYQTRGRQARHTGKSFSQNHLFDQLFMTTGAGAQWLLNRTALQHTGTIGPLLGASIGKWLTPTSGVRLTGQAGYFGTYGEYRTRHASVTGGVDYLWNMRNSFEGYDPDRTFDLLSTVGVQLSYTGKMEHHWQPGVRFGMQGIWHIGKQVGLYLEPQVSFYGDSFAPGNLGWFKKDAMLSLQAGVHYRFLPYQKGANRQRFEQDDRRMFVSAAYGLGGPLVINRDFFKALGHGAQISVGQWFSPLSAWRLSGRVMRAEYTNDRYMHYAGLEADYMMSLMTLANGYRPKFDIVPFVGVNAGASYRKQAFAFVPGVNAGVQLKYGFKQVDLFIEPQVGLYSDHLDGITSHRADRVFNLLAGVSYKPLGNYTSSRKRVDGFKKTWTVALGGGVGLQNDASSRNQFSSRYMLTVERRFSALSGLRLGYSNTNYRRANGANGRLTLNGVHADYLLDLTTLLNGYSPDRRFTFSGIVGSGVFFSSDQKAKAALGLDLGVQAKWQFAKQFDLFAEPMVNIYNSKAGGGERANSSVAGNLTFGIGYRF